MFPPNQVPLGSQPPTNVLCKLRAKLPKGIAVSPLGPDMAATVSIHEQQNCSFLQRKSPSNYHTCLMSLALNVQSSSNTTAWPHVPAPTAPPLGRLWFGQASNSTTWSFVDWPGLVHDAVSQSALHPHGLCGWARGSPVRRVGVKE